MIILLLILLGLCFGSFINALVWRLYQQQLPRKKRPAVDLSITRGRSVCVHCNHTLSASDLIPVISWVFLRGKCRYCKKTISWQYPAVELFTSAAFVVSYLAWPLEFGGWGWGVFGVWLGLLVVLLALAVYDIRWMELPDRLVAIAAVLAGVLVLLQMITNGEFTLILGAIWGVLCLAGLFYVIFQVSGGRWIGGGDVKLGVPLGIAVGGPVASILVLFLASVSGTIMVLPLLLLGKRQMSQKLPFGPFLILAAIIVFLWGSSLVSWYETRLLLLSS